MDGDTASTADIPAGSVVTPERLDELWPNKSQRLFCLTHVKDAELTIGKWIDAMNTASPYKLVVLVDDSTTDNTSEIAKKMGAEVFSFTWRDNYAFAKNCCVEVAKTMLAPADQLQVGDWCLFAGDDMVLNCGPELRDFINVPENFAGQFWVVESLYPLKRPRKLLYRYHPDIFWERDVHEEIYPSINRLIQIGFVFHGIDVPPLIGGSSGFTHYGHELDQAKKVEKVEYYRQLYNSYWAKQSLSLDKFLLGEVYQRLSDGMSNAEIIAYIDKWIKNKTFEEYSSITNGVVRL